MAVLTSKTKLILWVKNKKIGFLGGKENTPYVEP